MNAKDVFEVKEERVFQALSRQLNLFVSSSDFLFTIINRTIIDTGIKPSQSANLKTTPLNITQCLVSQLLMIQFTAIPMRYHSIEMNSKATHLKFVCPRITQVISILMARQLHFLVNKNAKLTGGGQ